MNKLLYTFIALFLAGNYANAQQTNWCGSAAANRKIFDENPRIKEDYEALFLDGMSKSDDSTTFTISVVFHVLHEYGVENISDAQIFNQMEILNRDFRATNSDTSLVVNPFKQIVGDAKIQFKLANYDPLGNCTNGIDRIYTHLTNDASDLSKLNQWYRPNYLNVWVTKTIGSEGTAGYAYYPNSTNGTSFTIDGIIILHDFIGAIGTGIPSRSRALTHEIGHWLSLAHTWGNSNNPGLAANCDIDDLLQDTPLCQGVTSCANVTTINTCNDTIDPNDYSEYTYDVIDNIQNYMDYSYCSVMFTKQQVAKMREALQGSDGYREELITPETHAATGIDLLTPATCIPEAAYFTTNRNPCVGTSIVLSDQSTKGAVASRLWTFQDATPSTSTAANPTVVFNSQGAKNITLTVTNSAGSNTVSINDYVVVNNNWADYVGPFSNDLNGPQSNPEWFRVENLQNNEASFQYQTTGGKGNSGCFKLNNYKDVSAAQPFSPDSYYYPQLEGVKDHLITPSYDLRFTTGAVLSFDYSYASNANTIEQITESIELFKSNDCGVNWNSMGNLAKVQGAELISSGGFAANSDFAPANDGQWKTKTVNFNTTSVDSKTRFRFTFRASSKSSNLYIDNINITGNGTAGIGEFGFEHDLVIAPNPVNAGSNLNISYTAKDEPVTFTLRNLQGQEVMTTVKNEMNQMVSFNLELDSKLTAAYYFLEVKSASATTVKKIVVMGN